MYVYEMSVGETACQSLHQEGLRHVQRVGRRPACLGSEVSSELMGCGKDFA